MSEKLTKFFSNKLRKRIFLWLGANQGFVMLTKTYLQRKLEKPYMTINYHITKFKQEGLIDKYLKLTNKGARVFDFLWKNENVYQLRAHNIQVKFKIVKCPDCFPDCFSKNIYNPLSNGKYKGIQTSLNNMMVMFYSPKKIVCTLPDVYANTDDEIISAIQLQIPNIISVLEDEFKGIKVDDYQIAKIQTMHVAILNSIYAKSILLKDFTYEGENIAVDNSHGIPELELTNSLNCLMDIDLLMKAENDFATEQSRLSNNKPTTLESNTFITYTEDIDSLPQSVTQENTNYQQQEILI